MDFRGESQPKGAFLDAESFREQQAFCSLDLEPPHGATGSLPREIRIDAGEGRQTHLQMSREISNRQWLGRMALHKRFDCLDQVPFPSSYFCPYFASGGSYFGRRNQYANQFQHGRMRQKFESGESAHPLTGTSSTICCHSFPSIEINAKPAFVPWRLISLTAVSISTSTPGGRQRTARLWPAASIRYCRYFAPGAIHDMIFL